MIIDVIKNWDQIHQELGQSLGLTNKLALPRITKVTISTGVGPHRANKDMIFYIEKALASISGQKPVATKAKKSVSSFKIRQGDIVGFKVTLRGPMMADFLKRLINVTFPRIRDFRGIDERDFDKLGNLTFGFKDQTSFVETVAEALDRPFGLAITISVARSSKEKSFVMFKLCGFPMKQVVSNTQKK